jgi:tRNA modification GTPase
MDTIAAIATGTAATAIGVLRISGENCFAVCDRVFQPLDGTPLSAHEPRKMIYGDVVDADGALLDRGLAVRFPAPRSYTGEDCAEFDCHGSPIVLREALNALFAAGARQARAGEFTKRAFLNGRMDLTQAEAVVDLIDAETADAARNAARQLNGALRRQLEEVQTPLLDIASRFYAVVDYPDEDIQDIHPAAVADALLQAETALSRLLSTCERGKILKSGVRTAIAGSPNVGKSSLLNALAGYERAIVTDIPGTTRDTVEESVRCGGVLLRLIDTAGIHKTDDLVEKLGVQRSQDALKDADLVFAVADGSREPTAEDAEILRLASQSKHWILLLSKRDLPSFSTASVEKALDSLPAPAAVLEVSSVTGQGLDALESAVQALFPAGSAPAGSLLTDARQEDAARRARDAVGRGAAALRDGMTPDAVLSDVEDALNALGELTGRTAKEEIVETIFSRFCVGK